MKKNATLLFTKIIYALFIIGTIITMLIVYKTIDSRQSFKFLIGYVFLTFFLVIYVFFITIFNLRKLKWIEIRRRLFKFSVIFILFGILNVGFDYVFRPSNIDVSRNFSVPLGMAFGLSFLDITFLKKKLD